MGYYNDFVYGSVSHQNHALHKIPITLIQRHACEHNLQCTVITVLDKILISMQSDTTNKYYKLLQNTLHTP